MHLAPSPTSLVGRRSSVDLLLEVSPSRVRDTGVEVFDAPNGVILVRRVPVGAIVEVQAATRLGRVALADTRRLLHLP